MTRTEAKIALNEGYKVTHEYFTSEEYITPEHMFEDGYNVPIDWWDKEYLKDGWSIYKES